MLRGVQIRCFQCQANECGFPTPRDDARPPQSQRIMPPTCTYCTPQLGQDFRSHRGLSTPHVSQGKLGVLRMSEVIFSPRARLTPTLAPPIPCTEQTTGVNTSPIIPQLKSSLAVNRCPHSRHSYLCAIPIAQPFPVSDSGPAVRRTVPWMSRAHTPGQWDHLAPVEDQRDSDTGFAPQFDNLGVIVNGRADVVVRQQMAADFSFDVDVGPEVAVAAHVDGRGSDRKIFQQPLIGKGARPRISARDDEDLVSLAVKLQAPIDHRSVRRALRTGVMEGSESVRLGLKVGHRTDIAQRAVHIDSDCRSAVQHPSSVRITMWEAKHPRQQRDRQIRARNYRFPRLPGQLEHFSPDRRVATTGFRFGGNQLPSDAEVVRGLPLDTLQVRGDQPWHPTQHGGPRITQQSFDLLLDIVVPSALRGEGIPRVVPELRGGCKGLRELTAG